MEDDRLQIALLDWEGEGGSVAPPAPERAAPSELDRGLDPRFDPRHRRGSIGPPPLEAPLAGAASSAALHAHLARLIVANRDAKAVALAISIVELPSLHEDVERQPDGIPHLVIGLTALFSVVLAAVLIGILTSGPTFGSIAIAAGLLISIPVVVLRLGAKAERDRDHRHPSR